MPIEWTLAVAEGVLTNELGIEYPVDRVLALAAGVHRESIETAVAAETSSAAAV